MSSSDCASSFSSHLARSPGAYAKPWSATEQELESAWAIVSQRPAHITRETFLALRQMVVQELHKPVTCESLLQESGHAQRTRKKSWTSVVEAISRCVAAYHHAFNATEQIDANATACDVIQENILHYAQTLKQFIPGGAAERAQFATLLDKFIENRAFNMALRTTIDGALDDLPFWKNISDTEREAAVDILTLCMDALRMESDQLRSDMGAMRTTL